MLLPLTDEAETMVPPPPETDTKPPKPPALWLLPEGYQAFHECPALLPLNPGCGTVLVVDWKETEPVGVPERELIHRARMEHHLSVALRLECLSVREPKLIIDCQRMGIRAVISKKEPAGPQLRQWIPDFDLTAQDWLEWVNARCSVPPLVRADLDQFLVYAMMAGRLEESYKTLGIRERTLRDRLKRAALPPPEPWFIGARILSGHLRLLERGAGIGAIGAIAGELGYSEAHSLSSMSSRIFGVTMGRAGRLLGTEWRFHGWWRWARNRGRTKHLAGDPAQS